MNIPESYTLDLSTFSILDTVDQLRPHMWHHTDLVEFTPNGVKLKTQKISRNLTNAKKIAAVSSIVGSGFSYGIYEFEAKLPAAAGSWPSVWLINGRTEIDLLEGKPRRWLRYFDPGLRGLWRVYGDYHQYSYLSDGTKETISLGHLKLSLGWRNPAKWQRYVFGIDRHGIALYHSDVTKGPEMIYDGPIDLHGPLHLYLTNWVWPHAVSSFEPGTFEVRKFNYLPFV